MLTVKQKNIIYIIIILLVAVFFRFYDLEKRGLFDWDEGYYVELTKTYRAGFDYLFKTKILNQRINNMGDYILENGGAFDSFCKDGFVYFVSIISIIFGMDENTVLFTNALIGTLTVLLLYLFLRDRISQIKAFLIALAFSISPYHVEYSRSGFTTILAAFFLLISVYLYTRYLEEDKKSLLFYSGLSLGLSFSCHYVVGLFALVIFGYEIYHILLKKKKFKQLLLLLYAFFTPLLIIEPISRLIKFFIHQRLLRLPMANNFTTYFERFLGQMTAANGAEVAKNISPFYYLINLIFHEGIIIAIFFFILLALFYFRSKNNKLNNIFLTIIFIIPFIFLSLKYNGADRVMPLFIPLLYFIIGHSLFYLNKYKIVFLIILIISICQNTYKSLDYFNCRSNFDKVVSYMQKHEGIKHISDDMYVSRAYIGRKNAIDDFISVTEKPEDYHVSLKKIKDLYEQGYKYLVLYDQPYCLNELTQVALKIKPDFSVESIGSNRDIHYTELGFLKIKPGKPSCYIYVYSMNKVIRKLESKNVNY